MKRFATLAASLAAVFTLGFAGIAAAAPATSAVCQNTTATYSFGAGRTVNLTVSNARVQAGAGSKVTVTGDNNCISVGATSTVQANGNGNYVSGGAGDTLTATGASNTLNAANSKLTLQGTDGLVDSQGNNRIDGGGNACKVTHTDQYVNCVVQPTSTSRR